MSLFSHIIVGYDFSRYADEALKQAVFLGHQYKVPLTIFHSLEKNPEDPIWEILKLPIDVEMKIQNQILAKLHEFFPKEKLGVDYEVVVEVEGRVDESMISLAEKKKADLIVVGTHGRTALEQALLGSHTENIVRRAPCPTWIVRSPAAQNVQNILVPVDFSPSSESSIRFADTLASEFKSTLTLMNVVSLHSVGFLYGEEAPAALENARETILEKASQNLKGILSRLKAPVLEEVCLEGIPTAEIERLAKEKKVDLIVMTTHGRRSKKSHLGKVTTHLIRHAPCSVLVIPYVSPVV